MKKKIFLILTFMLSFGFEIFAQYPIGHQSLTYQDPARANRDVDFELYYPATSAGESTPFASGQFPLIAFGHGFAMGVNAYAYFYNAMAALGYIIALPSTESSMTGPSHPDFGLDLAFLIDTIKGENLNSSSLFYNKVAATSAIMGHSMGGGASFLGGENNTVPTCMVNFAAAETDPSSTAAAANVTIPALVIAGSDDCVAPPADNQVPMYNALASACKVYISITGGGHCYFADYNFACTFGEQTCHPGSMDITEADQHDVVLDFVQPYLDYYLRGNASAWTTFNDSLTVSPRITHQISCPTTGINEFENNSVSVWPNPADDQLYISSDVYKINSIKIYDLTGKLLIENANETEAVNIKALSDGLYTIEIETENFIIHKKIIKH